MLYYLSVFMGIKLNFDSSFILEKQFNGQLRGYDAYEVDKFLDLIIKDYKIIESNHLIEKEELDQLKNQIAELEKKCSNLEIEINKYRTKLGKIKDSNVVNSENLELVKKITALENFIYSHGFDPRRIK